MDSLLDFLRQGGGPVTYLLLVAAAAVEYVFPPFPGDTVVLFGAFLAATANYAPAGVYAALTVGSLAGGMASYAFGRLFHDESRWPGWLRGPRARWALRTLRQRFERYGAVYLALNRFLPAMRAFFFVAAGLARMPPWKVMLYGGISAAAWNALLLGAGYLVGNNWSRLRELSEQYTAVVLTFVGVIIAIMVLRVVWRRRRQRDE